MKDKKSFVLRIDPEMYDALEKWASDEFRSVNGQIEWMIAKQLKESNRWKTNPTKKENATTKKPEN
ncbi:MULTISPECIES: hypothetical protein [Chitinophagaceae]